MRPPPSAETVFTKEPRHYCIARCTSVNKNLCNFSKFTLPFFSRFLWFTITIRFAFNYMYTRVIQTPEMNCIDGLYLYFFLPIVRYVRMFMDD